jgi:hypothetical protein
VVSFLAQSNEVKRRAIFRNITEIKLIKSLCLGHHHQVTERPQIVDARKPPVCNCVVMASNV